MRLSEEVTEAVSEDISFTPIAADAERARACMMQRREAELYRQMEAKLLRRMELESCRREKQRFRHKCHKWLDRLVPLFVLLAEAAFGTVLYVALFL